MGWKASETRIEAYRRRVAEAPAATREEIRATLERDRWTRTERARLRGLEVAACTTLGDYEPAGRAYRLAIERPVTPAATAEIKAQYARLCATSDRLTEAADVADKALEIAQHLPLEIEPGQTAATRRRRRWYRYLYASVLVISGDVARLQGNLSAAFDRALTALEVADKRSGAWRAAVGLLAVVCLAGPMEAVKAALTPVRAARKGARGKTRIYLRWIEALIAARLGSTEWAEHVLSTDVMPKLEEMGDAFHGLAVQHYLWVVERSSPSRALYLRRSYGLETAEPPYPD